MRKSYEIVFRRFIASLPSRAPEYTSLPGYILGSNLEGPSVNSLIQGVGYEG